MLSGAFASTAEQLIQYPSDPSFYAANESQFYSVPPGNQCDNPPPDPASGLCPAVLLSTPAGDGSFSQNIQTARALRPGFVASLAHLTVNYGLRYQTTFGLFEGSGRSQDENNALITLKALQIPLRPARPMTTASKSLLDWELPTRREAVKRP